MLREGSGFIGFVCGSTDGIVIILKHIQRRLILKLPPAPLIPEIPGFDPSPGVPWFDVLYFW